MIIDSKIGRYIGIYVPFSVFREASGEGVSRQRLDEGGHRGDYERSQDEDIDE